MTKPFHSQIFALAIILFATPSVAGPFHGGRPLPQVHDARQDETTAKAHALGLATMQSALSDRTPGDLETSGLPLMFVSDKEPDTTVLALMSGKCPTLKIAGRDFRCRAVAFYQTELGRANFSIALDDPGDNSHIITFSGDNGLRIQDNLYQLPIDRMLLNSKTRPKVDGLPVPFTESSTGMCTQLGNFKEKEVSSISCSATDKDGKKYELQYVSDGSPITLRRVRRTRTGRPLMSPFD